MKKSAVLLALASAAVTEPAVEIVVKVLQKPAQELPDSNNFDYYSANVNGKRFEDLYLFLSEDENAPEFTEQEIYDMLLVQSDYLSHRFDCSDFRAQLLFRLYKEHNKKLSPRCSALIKKTFLDFKYFMDEPGYDSMCYWSENHQILFAVAEYLAGQEWENEIFSNSGMTGLEHKSKAYERISAWMEQRFAFGFSEYLSNNYLAEDIAPMANFISYAEDETAVEKMKIIMDILWFDVALNSVNGRLSAVSSRMYGNNKAGNYYGNSIAPAMNLLWGNETYQKLIGEEGLSQREKQRIKDGIAKRPNHIVICFTDTVKKGKYELPAAIKDIALSRDTFEVKMSCGLSPDDLVNEGLVGQKPAQIMAQLGAETFTNPQVINNSVKYLKKNGMFRNSFVSYFKYTDITALKLVDLQKAAAKYNVMPHGIATGRGNIYTYRTSRYALSTVIGNDPDRNGAQDHEWSANISEELCLFTTHPAGRGDNRFSSSPGYWIGNGRRPMSVQHKNVNITLYKLPEKARLGEMGTAQMTHAYMPVDFYDEFELSGNTVFARKNEVFVALISNGELRFKPYDMDSLKGLFANLKRELSPDELPQKEFDLCRFGDEYHIYITEISDSSNESFSDFKQRISENTVSFENGRAEYTTSSGKITASFDGEFTVNGKSADKEFMRYDCPFCKAPRKGKSLFVDSGKHTLLLDFEKAERTF